MLPVVAMILSGMQGCGSGAKGSAFTRAHFAGDHGGEVVFHGIGEALLERLKAWQGIKLFEGYVLGEGLAGEPVGVGECDHVVSPVSKRLPPL
jgi:hypothetical protein